MKKNIAARSIKRAAFETCGSRSITIAKGLVLWPDGRECRYNVRLVANPGEDGDVILVAEDINRPADRSCKTIKLAKKS
jgi:hypothetical protein